MRLFSRSIAPSLLMAALAAPAPAQELLVGGSDAQVRSGNPALGAFEIVGASAAAVRSMTVAGPATYIGDAGGRVYSHRPGATVVHAFDTGTDAQGLAAHGGQLVVAASDGTVERYDLVSHALRGTLLAPISIGAIHVAGDMLYVGGPQGTVLRADLSAGSPGFQFWASCAGSITALTADDTALIAGTASGIVHRLDFATQTITASFATSGDAAALGLHLGDLLVADTQGRVQRVDRTTGFVHDEIQVGSGVQALSLTSFEPPGSTYCYGEVCPCGNEDPLAGCANSTGRGAFLRATGSASVAADDLTLFVTNVPASQFGVFFIGDGSGWTWVGDGEVCSVGGASHRFRPERVATSGFLVQNGFGAYASGHFDPTGQLLAGSTWTFQFWYRDPDGPCGGAFNLSNGYSLTFTP